MADIHRQLFVSYVKWARVDLLNVLILANYGLKGRWRSFIAMSDGVFGSEL